MSKTDGAPPLTRAEEEAKARIWTTDPDPANGHPHECPECGSVETLRRGMFGWECRYCATEQG